MAGADVVLITGTSSGFGRLLAEACARKGYTVYASMRQARGRWRSPTTTSSTVWASTPSFFSREPTPRPWPVIPAHPPRPTGAPAMGQSPRSSTK